MRPARLQVIWQVVALTTLGWVLCQAALSQPKVTALGNLGVGVTDVSKNPGSSVLPALKASPDGSIHLAWADNSPGNLEVLYSSWNGKKWSLPINLSMSPAASAFPSMTVDATGGVHLTWMEGRGVDFEIYYTHSTSEGWAKPLNISNRKGLSQRPQVAVDSFGTVHVIWYDRTDSGLQIFHCRRTGTTWSKPTNTGLLDWYITQDPSYSMYVSAANSTY